MTNRRTWLLTLLLAFVFLSRAISIFLVWRVAPERLMVPDSWSYENSARAMLELGRFSQDPKAANVPQLMRTPGYPVFIATVYWVAGQNRLAVILVQILASAVTVGLIFGMARRLWGEPVAWLAALILALDPVSFLYSQLMLTETLFTTLLVLGMAAGVELARRPGRHWLWALGLGAGLAAATMVRPISYYLIFPVLLWLAVVERRARRPWPSVAASAFCLMLPWLALVGGWQLRNWRLTGDSDFCHIKNYNLLFYRAAGIVALRDRISVDQAQEKLHADYPGLDAKPPAQRNAIHKAEAIKYFRAYPALLAKVQLWGMAKLILGPGGNSIRFFFGIQDGSAGPAGDLLRLSLSQYIRKWPLGKPCEFGTMVFESFYLLLLYATFAFGIWRAMSKEQKIWPIHFFS